MKKICVIIILIVFSILDMSFAQRYHFDIEDDEPSSEAKPYTRPKVSDPKPMPYRQGYRNYPEKKYLSENPYPVFSIEANGGPSVFEGRILATWPVLPNTVSFGVNGLVTGDDLYVISGDLTFGNRLLDEQLILDIGLRGLGGEAEKRGREAVLGAVGFIVKIAYDLPDIEVLYNRYLDIDIMGEMFTSPGPLSFGDTDQYLEVRGGLGFNLSETKRSTIVAGYRYIRADVDDGRYEWKKIEDSFYIGYRLSF